jgi:hypothetical protein
MSSINRGFDKLRVKLPQTAYEKKPSKVDTLRQAIDYIHRLKEILDESGGSGDGGGAPIRISAQPLPPPPPPPNRVVIECPIGKCYSVSIINILSCDRSRINIGQLFSSINSIAVAELVKSDRQIWQCITFVCVWRCTRDHLQGVGSGCRVRQ